MTHHQTTIYGCTGCDKVYKSPGAVLKHMSRKAHGGGQWYDLNVALNRSTGENTAARI